MKKHAALSLAALVIWTALISTASSISANKLVGKLIANLVNWASIEALPFASLYIPQILFIEKTTALNDGLPIGGKPGHALERGAGEAIISLLKGIRDESVKAFDKEGSLSLLAKLPSHIASTEYIAEVNKPVKYSHTGVIAQNGLKQAYFATAPLIEPKPYEGLKSAEAKEARRSRLQMKNARAQRKRLFDPLAA